MAIQGSSSPALDKKTVRQDLGEVITEVFDKRFLTQFAKDIRNMTKGYRGQGRCPDCGSMKQVMVELPDLSGQLKALTELLEQAEGRPGTQQDEAAGLNIIVERIWPSSA